MTGRDKRWKQRVSVLMPSHSFILRILKLELGCKPGLEFLIPGRKPHFGAKLRRGGMYCSFRCQIPSIWSNYYICRRNKCGGVVVDIVVIQWCASKCVKPRFVAFARLTSSSPDLRALTLELGRESVQASSRTPLLVVSSFALSQMEGTAKLHIF